MKSTTQIIFCCIAVALLSACGGGGGSSGSSSTAPSVATFNYQAAVTKMYQTGQNVSFNASLSGSTSCSGSGSYVQSPATTATTFNITPTQSVNALSGTETITINWTNCTPASLVISATDFINTSATTSIGFLRTGDYEVNTVLPVYPTTVHVGDSGSLGTTELYTDSTETTRTGYAISKYAVTAGGSSSSVTITETDQYYDTSNSLLNTQIIVMQLSSSNTLSITSLTIFDAQNGDTIILR